MKAVITLGALALVLVSGLEQNEEESQLSLSEGTLQREARDVLAGKRRKNQKKGGKKNVRKSVGKKEQKTKKRGSKRRGSKKNIRKGGGINKKKTKKKGGKRKGSKAKVFSARQACPIADMVTAIRGYRNAGNQKRKAMRIIAWKNTMGKKKDKAATQFSDAADSLDAATNGGQTCGSGKPDSATTEALAKLKNCSTSAAALCDNSTVNDTGADACKTKFVAYIKAFEDCLDSPSCDCFKELTPVESSCKFNDANLAAKKLKEKCFSSDTPGSFGDCSSALKKASRKIGKCGCGAGTTTKSARNLRRLAFHKYGGDSNI